MPVTVTPLLCAAVLDSRGGVPCSLNADCRMADDASVGLGWFTPYRPNTGGQKALVGQAIIDHVIMVAFCLLVVYYSIAYCFAILLAVKVYGAAEERIFYCC